MRGLRPNCAAFGPIAVTGLRASEVLALRFKEVLPGGILQIRVTKFGRSRLMTMRRGLAHPNDQLPHLPSPPKILCVGLDHADHSAESGFDVPGYPTIFGRFASSLIGHGAPIVRPRVSEQLDYEGEFVAVIGRGGRDITKETALDHVIAYSLFNDGSIRDDQFKAPQWSVGKNFDDTGSSGPFW